MALHGQVSSEAFSSPMYGLVPAKAVALSPSFMMVAMLKSVRCACPVKKGQTWLCRSWVGHPCSSLCVPELQGLTLFIQEDVVRLDISRRTEGDKKMSLNLCHSCPDVSDRLGF